MNSIQPSLIVTCGGESGNVSSQSLHLPPGSKYEGTKHRTLTEGRRRGLPLDQRQKAAGHKDSRSTEIYAELAQEQATKVLRMARKPRSKRGKQLTLNRVKSSIFGTFL